jgi:hypothetical protein
MTQASEQNLNTLKERQGGPMNSKRSHARGFTAFVLSLTLSFAGAAMIGCGGSTTPTTATTGTVNVSMTDPATCTFAFSNVYVTVTKVTANINGDAGPNDSGWKTLIDLTKSPMQIDLLSLADATTVCLLKSLGASGPLPPGKYQQIRLYLLSNAPGSGVAVPSSNACGGSAGWNCVITGSGPVELQLPSEVQTGIKIPSANITNGGLTVTAGQSVDLNIDFKSCQSIVREGNGKFRLKPVLFGGEVAKNMNSISGQVVVGNSSGQPVLTSGQPTPIANATVLFEQESGSNETVVDSTTTDANGNFFVCPLPGSGNFDIVVTAQTGTTGSVTTYNPSVAFSVPLGTNLGQVPLVPEPVSTMPAGGAATIIGQTDTATSISEDVTLTATMSINSINVIIPVFSVNGSTATSPMPTVTTASTPTALPPLPSTCTAGSDCSNFSLTVPASNANFGTFSGGSVTYGGPGAGDINYTVTATSDKCTTGTASATTASPGVKPDTTTTLPSTLALSGCS